MVKPKQLPSGKWQAREYLGGGKYATLGTYDTEKEALKVQILAEAGVRPEKPSAPVTAPGSQIFAQYAEEVLWARKHELSFGTWESYESKLRKWINPTFGKKRLREITPSMVRRWFLSLPEMPSRKMIYVTLRMILQAAVDERALDFNPAQVKGTSKIKAGSRPTFSLADFEMLVSAASTDQQRALLWVLFGAGVRIGEALALNVQDIDLDHAEVTISKHLIRRGQVIQGTKHHAEGERVLALPRKAVDALRAHLESEMRLPADPVFKHSRGGRMSYDTAWHWFDGLRASVALDEMNQHDIRHVSLTLFARHATMAETMQRGGHSDYRSALRYQHSSRERDRAIIKAMEASL